MGWNSSFILWLYNLQAFPKNECLKSGISYVVTGERWRGEQRVINSIPKKNEIYSVLVDSSWELVNSLNYENITRRQFSALRCSLGLNLPCFAWWVHSVVINLSTSPLFHLIVTKQPPLGGRNFTNVSFLYCAQYFLSSEQVTDL